MESISQILTLGMLILKLLLIILGETLGCMNYYYLSGDIGMSACRVKGEKKIWGIAI